MSGFSETSSRAVALTATSRTTTAHQRHRATRHVASQARDVEDCRLLLDMLGLLDQLIKEAS